VTPNSPRPEPDPHALGRLGEDAAATYLRRAGYRILARNLRTRTGEIDLLVRRGRVLIAVEVKTRRHHAAPEWTVKPRQLERLERTLRALAATTRPVPRHLRVDVVGVTAWTADIPMEVRHFLGDERPLAQP
jgi:putative endonuclease